MFEGVEAPSHYAGDIEPIQFMKSCRSKEEYLGFCICNAIKYLARAGKKGEMLYDLKKARNYMTFAIAYLEQT